MEDPIDQAQRPFILELRGICEIIGYGRVIQLAETWMEEKNPGWLKARTAVRDEQILNWAALQAEPYGTEEEARSSGQAGLYDEVNAAEWRDRKALAERIRKGPK